MNCHYCGREIGIAAFFTRDQDFCSSQHRSTYHRLLRKGIAQIGGALGATTPGCGFRATWQPCAMEAQPRPAQHVGYSLGVELPILRLTVLPENFHEFSAAPASLSRADEPAEMGPRVVEPQAAAPSAHVARQTETDAPALVPADDRIAALASRLEQMQGILLNAGVIRRRRIA